MRKTISIDFDGVICLHDNPRYWIAPSVINGRANPEALRFMHAALEAGFDIVVHSCRFYDLGAPQEVKHWIIAQAELELGPVTANYLGWRIQYSLTKPTALIYIDDRGYRYEGRFPHLEDLK